ncbi:hypothetical protein DERF_000272 [Dermatophagoides farinae]|uniref:Uncharacterized protein n=1 Tax=Dermatophagoides farinae TaxID=6954 RepID=A0A922IB74_DERFA|nr:uncharacterized protein LOC124496093 [Dermatophagoides farinae]KAH7640642.1 hypothetical protein HUG17_8111 [Dermatophagoides farinae]KAH9526169.1 hypothetical protein DERF_000272 [Dermatophagoides farinae]
MDIAALKLFEHVPTLTDNNWPIWKWKVELALKHMEMWPLVNDGDLSQPNDDIKIRSLIGLWVDDSLVPLIKDCKTSHQMWTTLTEHFENEVQPSTSTTKLLSNPEKNSESKSIEKQEPKIRLKCIFCERDGHNEKQCWRKKRLVHKLKPEG